MSKQRMVDELEEIMRMYASSQDSYHRGVYEGLVISKLTIQDTKIIELSDEKEAEYERVMGRCD